MTLLKLTFDLSTVKGVTGHSFLPANFQLAIRPSVFRYRTDRRTDNGHQRLMPPIRCYLLLTVQQGIVVYLSSSPYLADADYYKGINTDEASITINGYNYNLKG